MNIVLTGFMASGKTQISKAISKIAGYNLVDTDALIEEKCGMSINDIFEEFGEGKFRELECEIVSEVSNLDNTVISTGGGVVLNPQNITNLRKNGIIVNLAPDFEVILERLNDARSTRPLLKNSDIESIHKRFLERIPYYADCDIQFKVTNKHSATYFAKKIIKLIQQ